MDRVDAAPRQCEVPQAAERGEVAAVEQREERLPRTALHVQRERRRRHADRDARQLARAARHRPGEVLIRAGTSRPVTPKVNFENRLLRLGTGRTGVNKERERICIYVYTFSLM